MPGTIDVVSGHGSGYNDLVVDSTYKTEVTYNSNGWNEWFGYGVVQPFKTMTENIFPEIKDTKSPHDSIFRLTVNNFPAPYSIIGDSVAKDSLGYYVSLTDLKPGKHTYTFVGKCYYDGEGT
jgi:hypothetical protein